jgi:hypothetical protein
MGKKALVLGLLLLCSCASSQAVDLHNAGVIPSDKQDLHDSSKEDVCDCCQKCKAAMSETKPKIQEGPATDGCKDCCERCGTVLRPAPQDVPPEVIDKRTAPDIIDKTKKKY